MLDIDSSLARLHAGYESLEAEKARGIVEDWRQIDHATIQTGLIPRYQKVFREAGLDPYFIVRSFGEQKSGGEFLTIKTRAVWAVDERRLDVMPGFVIDQVHWTPQHPIALYLIENVDPEWIESAKAAMASAEQEIEAPEDTSASPIPYWWPKEYGVAVGDFSDYGRDMTGWEAASQREFPNNPFRDGMEQSQRVFGEPDEFMRVWQEQSSMVEKYFSAISQALQSPQR